MTTNVAQLARAWLSRETWGIEPMSESDLAAVAKAVVLCAQADGQLSPAERDWILGGYAVRAVPAEFIDELRRYPGNEDLAKVLDSSKVGRAFARGVVYFAIGACGADGEIHALELDAIIKMGSLLDVPEDVVRQLKALYDEEQALRRRRIQLALPNGLPGQ
jgi:tellurite resistance protein